MRARRFIRTGTVTPKTVREIGFFSRNFEIPYSGVCFMDAERPFIVFVKHSSTALKFCRLARYYVVLWTLKFSFHGFFPENQQDSFRVSTIKLPLYVASTGERLPKHNAKFASISLREGDRSQIAWLLSPFPQRISQKALLLFGAFASSAVACVLIMRFVAMYLYFTHLSRVFLGSVYESDYIVNDSRTVLPFLNIRWSRFWHWSGRLGSVVGKMSGLARLTSGCLLVCRSQMSHDDLLVEYC